MGNQTSIITNIDKSMKKIADSFSCYKPVVKNNNHSKKRQPPQHSCNIAKHHTLYAATAHLIKNVPELEELVNPFSHSKISMKKVLRHRYYDTYITEYFKKFETIKQSIKSQMIAIILKDFPHLKKTTNAEINSQYIDFLIQNINYAKLIVLLFTVIKFQYTTLTENLNQIRNEHENRMEPYARDTMKLFFKAISESFDKETLRKANANEFLKTVNNAQKFNIRLNRKNFFKNLNIAQKSTFEKVLKYLQNKFGNHNITNAPNSLSTEDINTFISIIILLNKEQKLGLAMNLLTFMKDFLNKTFFSSFKDIKIANPYETSPRTFLRGHNMNKNVEQKLNQLLQQVNGKNIANITSVSKNELSTMYLKRLENDLNKFKSLINIRKITKNHSNSYVVLNEEASFDKYRSIYIPKTIALNNLQSKNIQKHKNN